MSDLIAPQKTVTVTITKIPSRVADRKTILRLMNMQGHIQRGLTALAKQRRRKDNITYIRAGVEWVNRKRTTKLCRVASGETFTLNITPQVIPDLKTVEKFLKASAA